MVAGAVVVGIDGSEASKRALRWAADYARMSGSSVEAVIAWDLPATYGMPALYDDVDLKEQAQRTLHDLLHDVLGAEPAAAERVERGHAGDVLVAVSEGAQLLVVGAHNHHGLAGRLLGSVSLHCAQHARCPVLVIRDHSPMP